MGDIEQHHRGPQSGQVSCELVKLLVRVSTGLTGDDGEHHPGLGHREPEQAGEPSRLCVGVLGLAMKRGALIPAQA